MGDKDQQSIWETGRCAAVPVRVRSRYEVWSETINTGVVAVRCEGMGEKSVVETCDELMTVFGDKRPSGSYVLFDSIRINRWCFRCFVPSTSISNENMVKTCDFVRSGHRLTIREIGDELDLSSYTVQSILLAKLWSREHKNIYTVYRNNFLLCFYLTRIF